MKKVISPLICGQLALAVFYPIGILISAAFGYRFTLAYPLMFAVVTASASVGTVILDFCFKHAVNNKVLCVLLSAYLPVALISAFFYMSAIKERWTVGCVLVCLFVTAVCCGILSIRHGKPLIIKVLSLILSVLLLFPIGICGFIVAVFGFIGQNTVVQTVKSPSGNYTAEIVDSDQGALGGDTIVYVYEKGIIDFVIFKVEKEPQTVYMGPWGEFKNMEIYWKNDRCLVINSAEYEIE